MSAEPPAGKRPDRTTRVAALWATAVAVPIALLAGIAAVALWPDDAPRPAASASAAPRPRPQSTAVVPVNAPALGGRAATLCRALTAKLPPKLNDLARRPVTAGAEQNAAYGDPALILRCGVPAPEVPSTDDVWKINGVCWHPVQRADATELTTVDREVPIQVTVPQAYPQALQMVAPVSTPAAAAVPERAGKLPFGCTG
ncbi:DUF3515 family protein [Plantactinospora siamensis]|uniref:DUF3515 family protein n=1 Tax=Plantactinospora siamensis TaxID=555372 RepID=A0ABV6NTA6_9ACTN